MIRATVDLPTYCERAKGFPSADELYHNPNVLYPRPPTDRRGSPWLEKTRRVLSSSQEQMSVVSRQLSKHGAARSAQFKLKTGNVFG